MLPGNSIIKLLVALIVLSHAISQKCDDEGRYRCLESQTCCRSFLSPLGWACFSISNGVCCSDGNHICPDGTACNMQDKTCVNLTIEFLSFMNPVQNAFSEPSVNWPQLTIYKGKDFADFTYGLIQGSELFSGLKNIHSCIDITRAEEAVTRILNVVHSLHYFDKETNSYKVAQDIIQGGIYMYDSIDGAIKACKDSTSDLVTSLDKIKNYLFTDGYVERAAEHILFNLQGFADRIHNGLAAFKKKDYFTSGTIFGELIHFSFFWDLNLDDTNTNSNKEANY